MIRIVESKKVNERAFSTSEEIGKELEEMEIDVDPKYLDRFFDIIDEYTGHLPDHLSLADAVAKLSTRKARQMYQDVIDDVYFVRG